MKVNLYLVYEGDYFLRVPDHVAHVYARSEIEAVCIAFVGDEKMKGHLEYKLQDINYLKSKLKTDRPIEQLFEGEDAFLDEYKSNNLSNAAIVYVAKKLNGLGFAAKKVVPVTQDVVAS